MKRTTRVLLVEDNPKLAQSLREALCAIDGVEVTHAAATTAEAAAWLQQHRGDWDLAVIDIFLREGHGFDVLRQCAGRDPGRRAVVLTNYTREPVRSAAEKLGADAVFDKSYELDAFLAYCADFARRPCAARSVHHA